MDSIVLNVPSAQAGAILGQGGARVSAIRQDTAADVRIQQGGSGIPLRRVEIQGENTPNALVQVLQAIEESSTEEVNLQVLISSHYAGGIIGPQGQTIQGLRSAYPGVQLHMEKNVGNSPERVIQVGGLAKDVAKAIMDIVRIIEDGLKDGSLTAAAPTSLKRPRSGPQMAGSTQKMQSGIQGRQHGYPGACKTEGQLALSISNEQAGKIIGKGGVKIHSIRQQCGCKIDLEPGNDRRTLRVTGALSNIEEACRVLSAYLED